MAPSLFTLPSFVLLFFINLALIYLCLNVKNGGKFCRAIPFFISGIFTIFIQLLIEFNNSPQKGVLLFKLQHLGFWSYFITAPLLLNALAGEEIKRWMLVLSAVLTSISCFLTIFTDSIITQEPLIYEKMYIARLGSLYPFIATLLFLICILAYRNTIIFVKRLKNKGLQFIMPIGLGLCIISGLFDYTGKIYGEPLIPALRNAFSIGMLSVGISFGIFILASYTQLVQEYKKSLDNVEMLLKKNNQNFNEFVQLIAKTIDAKDKYTAGHSMRVAEYAVRIARVLNIDEKQIELLKKACLLHDIGKIGIPDGVLNKKSPLSRKELNYIYQHPVLGKEILSQMSEFQEILDIIYFHHERYDGSGYPHGLKAEEIPLLARILAVADAYDAMLSERPYRPAKTKMEAIKELLNSKGKQFDPEIVEKFIDSLYKGNCEPLPDNISN
ncbi:MAG: HD-GYP domain-containing protein [candidate division WOR-3 bacterium]|nr:HD-GYP domain-containing protein [candidate division WOR-3 bacterium]